MFIGHFATGFLTKKESATLSLALMFIAVQFLDLLWPILVLLGIETVEIQEGITKLTPLDFTFYPWSHSLMMSAIWGLLFGGVYYTFTKNRKNALILAGLVVSHWVLDLLVHRPDLPLTPFSDLKVGLGLWNYPIAEFIIEFALFFTGIYVYLKSRPKKKKVAFWSLIGVLTVVQLLNFYGPVPPDTMSVALGANFIWLFVLWAWWIERDKQLTTLS